MNFVTQRNASRGRKSKGGRKIVLIFIKKKEVVYLLHDGTLVASDPMM